MSLAEYRRKRDFVKTSEPEGETAEGGKEGAVYVIQKHQATHLHYDLRLEKDGVLKSWAVPKEPPTEKGVKRLAMMVEDHPLEYVGFEGTIPKGEYGAGTVEVWDRGTYETEVWGENEIVVNIHGTRLNGRYCLVKFRKERNSWLLFKG